MDAKLLNSFLSAIKTILEQIGIPDVKKGKIIKKDIMVIDREVTSMIGLVDGIKGNVAYSMDEKTAKNIVSLMMMGMEVSELDEMARSALGELTNMMSGTASSLIASLGINFDITPPSIVTGKDVYLILSTAETICIELILSVGIIEVNFAIE
jgi:chemotaxis protein CheX